MWPEKFQNYRTARKGEVTCPECQYVLYAWWSKRPRCGDIGYSQPTGKTKTCDYARKRKETIANQQSGPCIPGEGLGELESSKVI